MATTETTPITKGEVVQKLMNVIGQKADVLLKRNDPNMDDENIVALATLYNAIKSDMPADTTPDTVSGGTGDETITGGDGEDTVTITGGSDTDTTVTGGSGDDTTGDTVDAGSGTDTTVGG